MVNGNGLPTHMWKSKSQDGNYSLIWSGLMKHIPVEFVKHTPKCYAYLR